MLKRVVCGQKALPQKGAPALLGDGVVQEPGVKEDSKSVQPVVGGGGVEVLWSRLPCLRLPPNLRQNEERRGLRVWFWSWSMVARKWTDVAGRKINPRVFTW